jgi:hypothetical protein
MEAFLKYLYLVSIISGIVICGYIFLHDPLHTSEAELVNSVFYWYFPLVFGIGGSLTLNVQQEMRLTHENAWRTLMNSTSSKLMVRRMISLPLLAFIGFIPHYTLLKYVDPENKYLSLFAALTGLIWMFLLLYFFFIQIWPSL